MDVAEVEFLAAWDGSRLPRLAAIDRTDKCSPRAAGPDYLCIDDAQSVQAGGRVRVLGVPLPERGRCDETNQQEVGFHARQHTRKSARRPRRSVLRTSPPKQGLPRLSVDYCLRCRSTNPSPARLRPKSASVPGSGTASMSIWLSTKSTVCMSPVCLPLSKKPDWSPFDRSMGCGNDTPFVRSGLVVSDLDIAQ